MTQPQVNTGKEISQTELVEGFRSLGLKKGDTVLTQNSYKAFGSVEGGPKTVIEALLEVLTPGGTLIMPAFNWVDFGEKKLYSKRNTKPQTGILSELFMSWPGCQRIYHPIHGFSLVGSKAEQLAAKVKNKSSFEESSLFGELYRMNAKLMVMGINYGKGLTFFHYVEESIGVPYRKMITLKGKTEELDGTIHDIEIPYYGRAALDMYYNLDRIEPFLEDPARPVVTVKKIGNSMIKIMNARDCFELIAETLKKHPNLVLTKTNEHTH